jgi:hypothetical protein
MTIGLDAARYGYSILTISRGLNFEATIRLHLVKLTRENFPSQEQPAGR